MTKVKTGLDIICTDQLLRSGIKGKIGYLCHPASVNKGIQHGIDLIKKSFGDQLIKIFSPQHGLFADVQDNMIESGHFFHKYFQLQVHSLYSETRKPTNEMLEGRVVHKKV